jgi:hypothetical protein
MNISLSGQFALPVIGARRRGCQAGGTRHRVMRHMDSQDVRVAGVSIAPSEVAVQFTGLDGAIGVMGVGEGELTKRPEVRLDRIGPRGVGKGEAQLNPVLPRPLADLRALVRGEVVQDHVDRCTVGARGPDRLQGGEGVGRGERPWRRVGPAVGRWRLPMPVPAPLTRIVLPVNWPVRFMVLLAPAPGAL